MSSNTNNTTTSYNATNDETTPINRIQQRSSNKRTNDNLQHLNQYDILNYKSITLENKGSVARDHMANERTFLAWLRTSLSFITLGIGITQLFRLEKPNSKIKTSNSVLQLLNDNNGYIRKLGKPLGSTFIIVGIITLLFGFHRYFQVQMYLVKNHYPATRLSLLILILIILILILITLIMVLKT